MKEIIPIQRPPLVERIDIEGLEPHRQHRLRVVMSQNATGNETLVPVIAIRGDAPGPVVGVTAAIHGNELNGIPVIHRLLGSVAERGLARGTMLAVPILNVPGYLRHQREFEDGVDLNRIMPGSPDGDESELYASRIVERLLPGLDYLIDLHTASFGRINSLYVRADMSDQRAAAIARLVGPQIIVHNPGSDGTLRAAAAARGIVAVTVEVGNPQRFQDVLVDATRVGIEDVLEHLGLLASTDGATLAPAPATECSRSRWLYTDRGGILDVFPAVNERVSAGDVVASLFNVWGDRVREYDAPEDGVVIGKSTNPTARAGSRILHLGTVAG
jgi:predicted deacylase